MQDARSRWLNRIGLALSLGAAAYFGWEIAFGLDWSNGGVIAAEIWPRVPLALTLYLIAFAPMATGWLLALRLCGVTVTARSAFRIFLISQFAKYLPGNVGHLIGRVVLAKREGIAAASASAAMLLEVAGVLVAASVLIGLTLGWDARALVNAPVVFIATLCAIALCLGGAFLIQRWKLDAVRLSAGLGTGLGAGLIASFVCVFALICGAQMVLLGIGPDEPADLAIAPALAGAILVSWLVGFVTPGAPAGLGVREVSLAVMLQGVLADEQIVLAAAAMRVITLAGDAIMWLVGLALLPQRRAEPLA